MSELNLIPQHIKQKRLRKLMLVQVGLVMIIVVTLLAAGIYYPYAKLKKLNIEEASLKSSIDKQKTVRTENERLKIENNHIKAYLEGSDLIQKNRVYSYSILKNLEKYIPKDTIIMSFAYGKENLEITAVSKQYNSVNEFQANLQETTQFSKSTISSVTGDDKTGEWTFTLTISDVKGDAK